MIYIYIHYSHNIDDIIDIYIYITCNIDITFVRRSVVNVYQPQMALRTSDVESQERSGFSEGFAHHHCTTKKHQ